MFIIKVCTSIIGFLMSGVIAYLIMTVNELKQLRTDVHSMNLSLREAVTEISSIKKETQELKEKAEESSDFRASLFRDFKIEKR